MMSSFSSLAQPGERKLLGLKLFYAKSLWAARSVLSKLGMYNRKRFQAFTSSTAIKKRYAASLFAIYDVREMARLDLAWWTFDAMVWVDNFLKSRPNAAIFEYGSGASTIWLARRAEIVCSVEDDPHFYRSVDAIKPANVNYSLIEADSEFDAEFGSHRHDLRERSYKSYVTALSRSGEKYDLIVIDGRCRRQCVAIATQYLKPGGVILIDNTDMRRYRDLHPEGDFETIVTRGMTPCLPYPTETSIFIPASTAGA